MITILIGPTLGALFPWGGPIQNTVLTPAETLPRWGCIHAPLCEDRVALTPNTVELILTLGSLFPRGGPVLDPVLAPPPSSPSSEVTRDKERLVFYHRKTSSSTAPCTSRRACYPTHCANYSAPCQPRLRAFSRWIRSPPPTHVTGEPRS